MKQPVIALITDFGEGDFFVGSMKAVITKILPAARIIDITHTVPSFDIRAGAFILLAACPYFPKGTVFLAVVDPGVGSRRKVIMVQTEDYYFIAPDNGILSPILAKYPPIDKCEVTETAYFLPEVSFTFEARDRMAPAAAWLASGVPLKKFGIVLSDYERLELSEPAKREQGIEGEILYADKFGNLITNIPESWLDDYIEEDRSELKLTTGEGAISYKRNYAEAGKGELLFLPGSLGLIEIAAREGSASERLCLPPGTAVWIRKKA